MKKLYEEPLVKLLDLDAADLISTSSTAEEPDCDLASDIFF